MIETISLAVGKEQTFTLLYKDVIYEFTLSFNDFNEYWIMDIYTQGQAIITGLPMIEGLDVLEGFSYLKLGKFMLVDTNPHSTTKLDIRRDLGDRLKLVRNYDNT